MQKLRILSTPPWRTGPAPADAPARPGSAAAVLVFDACHVGVVLRAVLAVEAVAAVALLFAAPTLMDWLQRLALATAAALPGTLAWLVAGCALKRVIGALPVGGQWAAGVLLGVLAGLYGCAQLAFLGLLDPVPWLASAAAGALMSAALVAGLVWRAKARMPAATAARLGELQARIRPHFLFNTLNSAIALVRADPRRAEAVLEDLSELFRHALAEPREAVPLADELELARRYLAIEQVRFGERLRVRWWLDPAADRALVPPLMLQPLVENAVKHGVEPSVEGADIEVTTEVRAGLAVVQVTNTVPAGAGAPGHGVALANVRERLTLLHDVQARFVSGWRDGRFQVRIEVPL